MKTTYTYTVRNKFEIFGEPCADRCATLDSAERTAAAIASQFAFLFYSRDGGDALVYQADAPTGYAGEAEFQQALADESGATEGMPGRLPWATLVSRIRDAAVEITAEEA